MGLFFLFWAWVSHEEFVDGIQGSLARPWRFNELQKSIDGISQKALTEALRSMEADGIVSRTVYPEVPPRVEYSLTELGESMRPIIKSMESWGMAYKEQMQEEQYDR